MKPPTLAIAIVVVSSIPRPPGVMRPQRNRSSGAMKRHGRLQHAAPDRPQHRRQRAQQRLLPLALEPGAELPALLLVAQPPVRVHAADDQADDDPEHERRAARRYPATFSNDCQKK